MISAGPFKSLIDPKLAVMPEVEVDKYSAIIDHFERLG